MYNVSVDQVAKFVVHSSSSLAYALDKLNLRPIVFDLLQPVVMKIDHEVSLEVVELTSLHL